MSFGRPAGGPGGLSINTGNANSLFGSGTQKQGGLFAGTSQPQQGGGLFGSQSSQQSGGLFGSQPGAAQSTQQQGTGLFGSQSQQGGLFGSSSQPSQSQTQPGGGLFGQTAAQSQSQPQQGGGIFGASLQQSQPQQGGGLFGSQPQQSQPQQKTGLFGASNAQTQPLQGGGLFGTSISQPQPQQSAGLFGNSSTSQNQQQQSGGLFGSLNSAPKPSLFGGVGVQNQQAQQPQQSRSGLFGSTANANLGGNTLGGLSFGSSTAQTSMLQSQPVVPGVRIDVSNIRPTTRFTDLHEDLQRELELIDAMVLRQIDCHNQCKALIPSHAERLSYLPNDVDHVSRRVKTLTEALMNDAQGIDRVRGSVKQDGEDAKLSFAAIDNLRLQPQYHHPGLWSIGRVTPGYTPGDVGGSAGVGEEGGTRDLVAYFSQRADAMSRTLATYQQNLAEIESHLRGVEQRTGHQMQQLAFARGRDGEARTADEQVRELAGVLRDFENGILGVAGKVGAAREGVQQLILGAADDGGGSSDHARNGVRGARY